MPPPPPLAQDGGTPLYIAAQEGRTEVVRLLIGAGANKDLACDVRPALSPKLLAPLSHASGSPVARQDGRTPLFMAAFKGHTETVRLRLDAGADKTIATVFGDLPIDVVCDHEEADEANRAAITAMLH